jgi:hypothetical protein
MAKKRIGKNERTVSAKQPKPTVLAKASPEGHVAAVPSGDGQAGRAPRRRTGAKAKRNNGVTDLVKELWMGEAK